MEALALKELEELLLSLGSREGVNVALHREEKTKEYYFLAGMALLLIFMILASMFESFRALDIMFFTVPLAASGSMLVSTYTVHSPLSFNSYISCLISLELVVNRRCSSLY